MIVAPERFGLYATLEQRLYVVVSPDEMNPWLQTVIVAPVVAQSKPYPTRVSFKTDTNDGVIALDQLHSIDKNRLEAQLGMLDGKTAQKLCSVLQAMFGF